MPLASAREIERFTIKEQRPWQMRWEEDFLGVQARLRGACAELSGANVADISIAPCTSAALQCVAWGFPWQPGDEILLPQGEFPSNHLPWNSLASRGVVRRILPLWPGHKAGSLALGSTPPDTDSGPYEARIIQAIGPKTRMLALSWVRFQDGLKLDLQTLGLACEARGVHLIVDGIQAAGTSVLDLKGVSAFASGGQKGLLGPQGQGFLWTHPALRARLAPCGTWLAKAVRSFDSIDIGEDRDLLVEDGRRLEMGGPSLLGCSALCEAIRMLLKPGIARIERHIGRLQDRLLDGLQEKPLWAAEARRLLALKKAGRLGSLLSFHHSGIGLPNLESRLARSREHRITASLREGYLRIAFHGWHSLDDVDRTLAWLREG
ncbi:aminotransferase class V-fold PLP-dependent enzyme [Mesoterricola silvestris]|uniref:Aminotransferase class V domain-containing protein n=1 Tax=Mesoterricola silvestris TaxID=2927979 RepID=A0AA48GTF2_9BACT|nr:aminotransferase class V-fold PLP-dependent enzyme [Mesoterricola silvestris]BDU71431.1 hypothetical protein METEAL_06050 [Mesoterricola silvestris]